MARASGDDREAIDRAFAEMIAGYHLTADNPHRKDEDSARNEAAPEGSSRADEDLAGPDRRDVSDGPPGSTGPAGGKPLPRDVPGTHGLNLDNRWADEHPLFSYTPPPAQPAPPDPDEDDTFDPGPPPPWPHPSAAVLIGWIGVGYAVITMIAAALGAPVPRWAGWMAVGSFVGGFALLLSRLPRHRPPGAGDGAVL